jgi:hypothetical protein
MIELKVQCDCGQKYKFDVEPSHGRMPFTVNCPVCGADGTENANALIQQLPAYQVAPPAPAPSAPAATESPKLRISRSAPEAPAAAPPPISPLAGGSPSAPPPPIAAPRRPIAATALPTPTPGRKPSFAMGLLGGLVGALIGAAIYFLIFKYTGLRFKLLAVGVGGLAGWFAELLGKGEGSKELGGITAVFVLVGIVGAQYFVALGWWHEALGAGFTDSAYAINVKQAKEVVIAVPDGSDVEIRNYLAKEDADEGDKPDPSSVSADDVKQFREKDLPEFQDLASGRITEAQYNASKGINPDKEKKLDEAEESTFKGVFLLLLISKANIISMVVAAGVAFRLSANA